MTKTTSSFEQLVDREKGLKQSLTSGQLSMIAIGGAIGTGLFLGSGFAIGFAGPSVLVSYGIGALIALLLMGCLAEMTVRHPTSGSFGSFAEFYVSPGFGFAIRYAYWSSIVFAVGTEITAAAMYMKYWYPEVPGGYWMVAFSVALILANAFSVKVFGAIEYVFSLLKLCAIVVFILLGAWVVYGAPADSAIGFANYSNDRGFFPNGLWGTWVAVIVAFFSYLSIEMIAVAAGEAKDPQSAVTRAFRITVVRLVVFYLLTIALVLAIVPWGQNNGGQSPFVTVMEATGVPYAGAVFNAVILIAALSAMNSQLYITTRLMFSLSRAGQAPKVFGTLSGKGVPLPALLLSSVGIALATLLYLAYPEKAFTLMMSIAMFGAMFTWAGIFLTHLFFRRRQGGQPLAFKLWGYPWTSLAGLLLMLALMVTTLFTEEFAPTLLCGLPFLAVILLIYALRFRQRAPLEGDAPKPLPIQR
ncbi:amino acid permease [Pseudomonas solani]|uniref:Amino acid permease n=1 Tax=Pseudomonas solani TaxID=2731552 RepID=A0ABM7LBL5_9PSED|nr:MULTISPECIES: amino acid permease [Pseudomonas]MDN4148629.1 amino acid permease [Pseudomonas tohonis]MDU9414873.1 amino acid permease [Pseudomonas sp. zfem005]WCD81819.1 amino acid permease [Pseudomonas sp. TUM22785]BCD86989.1 amino acid permease [Pseudomonas solani]